MAVVHVNSSVVASSAVAPGPRLLLNASAEGQLINCRCPRRVPVYVLKIAGQKEKKCYSTTSISSTTTQLQPARIWPQDG